MRKPVILLLIVGLMISHLSFAQNADQEAIKSVCKGETRAFLDRDYDAWAGYHAQTPEEQISWNTPEGTFGSISGWETLSKEVKEWYKDGKIANPTVFENTDFTILIKGDMAFAAYTSMGKNEEGKAIKSREHRTLLKMGSQWKIVAVQAFMDYKAGQ